MALPDYHNRRDRHASGNNKQAASAARGHRRRHWCCSRVAAVAGTGHHQSVPRRAATASREPRIGAGGVVGHRGGERVGLPRAPRTRRRAASTRATSSACTTSSTACGRASSCCCSRSTTAAARTAPHRGTRGQPILHAHMAPVLTEIRQHNPLLFDFVLKRNVRVNGKGFAAAVFETRAFFTPRRQAVPRRDFSGQMR